MEEKKNIFLRTETNKLYMTKSHKSVNFSLNIFSNNLLNSNENTSYKKNILNTFDNINNTNNSNNKETNKNIFSSPIKKNFFSNINRKQSVQTPNLLYNSFKNNLRKSSVNIDISQNDKIKPNLNTISNKISNTINKKELKRLNTSNFMAGHRPSAFILKHKRLSNTKLFNKIQFRNSKNFNLDSTNKLNNFLKSDIDLKRTKTNLLTDRNKKDNQDIVQFNNNSRRSSVSSSKNNFINRNYIYKRMNTLSAFKITSKPNFQKAKKNSNKIIKPVIVNPLLISEEDKIFDEMKKYLCFKYEQKKLNSKSIEIKNNLDKSRMNSTKLNKTKNKIQTTDQIKLDYLYLTTTKVSKKIKYVKRKKNRQELAEYQNNLLDVIKPSISDYTYTHLKDRLIEIRLKNNKKYQNNYKRIKEIENLEEDIINEFNNTCSKCLKTFKRVREQKEMVHSTNLRVKLPLLNFISCLKGRKKQNKRK